MDEKNCRSLVGALGGGGGALTGTVILNYLLYPSWQKSIWGLNLTLGLIGAAFLVAAIFIQVKYSKKK